MSETLYDQAGAGGKAKAKDYAITPSYVLTRNGDSGLTVKVRVKFLHQVRDNTGALTDNPVDPEQRPRRSTRLGRKAGEGAVQAMERARHPDR